MFDSNNRVRRALKPPYVGHIKFISIILLVWPPMIAFITFIGSQSEFGFMVGDISDRLMTITK